MTGIPCKHAICVLDDEEKDPVNYVTHYYSSTLMTATYKENIKPVNGEKLWKKTHRTPIRIPEFRKPRGRPKNRDRRKEPFEDLQNKGKTTRHGRTFHCSRCGQAGHIKSGCRNEVVIVEGPKNRRGRPRKNPDDVSIWLKFFFFPFLKGLVLQFVINFRSCQNALRNKGKRGRHL